MVGAQHAEVHGKGDEKLHEYVPFQPRFSFSNSRQFRFRFSKERHPALSVSGEGQSEHALLVQVLEHFTIEI